MEKKRCIIYVGEFDLRNGNAQAYLVRNNAKIFNKIGYAVAFIGVNRTASFEEIDKMPRLDVGENNMFLELANTLSVKGLLKYQKAERRILSFMDSIEKNINVSHVISYQSPSYAIILKRIINWCRGNGAKYIVNCADITLFDSQPLIRRVVMKVNWNILHKINKLYSDGLIAVSTYIQKFFEKDGMPSIVIPPLFDDYMDTDYELAETVTFIYAGSPFVLKNNVKTVGMKDRLDKIMDLCLRLSEIGINYRLNVVGITKEMYINCVPRHKKALADNKDIFFSGRLSHDDTLNAVRGADYMLNLRDVNTMNVAGLSTKLVESVSLGTPVVMNSIGDSFHYLREGVTGFELTGNMDDDVRILTSLCNKSFEERMTLKRMCAVDRTFALEKYQEKFKNFLTAVSE